uniref:Ovule protein n=1 Tax=Heterorhabditis bacteriophora TaxID=37862 RepID=A0A1I7WD05_HETBA
MLHIMCQHTQSPSALYKKTTRIRREVWDHRVSSSLILIMFFLFEQRRHLIAQESQSGIHTTEEWHEDRLRAFPPL